MRRLSSAVAFGVVVLATVPSQAEAWHRSRATVFAVLPEGSSGPEGLEVAGETVYVTTFGFVANGPGSETSGQLFVFSDEGRLIRQVSIQGSSPNLLGVRVHPTTGALLVNDFGHAQVLEVNPVTGASSVFMSLPSLPHPSLGSGLNDLTFDSSGNVYVSDSFQGVIWKTTSAGGTASVWVDDPLLRTNGVPPFGANGLRFNNEETAMFVANTGDDTLVEIPIIGGPPGTTGTPGTPVVFVNSINGADGLIVDDDDNLWVAANQEDEIVVVDPTGRVIAKLGDFDGINESHGTPIGFLFPASLRFSGKHLLVTNLALNLRLFNQAFGRELGAIDTPWTLEVTRYTIARIPARIPPLSGLEEHEGEDDLGAHRAGRHER